MDKERDTREAIIEDAGETEDNGRDLVHGDGGTIDLPTKPGDLSKDDQATPQAAYLDDTILPVFPDVLNPVHATSPGT
jgi:hypothetical protein